MKMIEGANAWLEKMKDNYFGIMSISLLAGTCIASMALIFILYKEAPIWQIAIISCTAMGSNAASIAHSPLKWVFWMFVLSVFTSIFLVFINLF